MRVLVSAIACNPAQGSEGAVGWKAISALAGAHHVHVLTSEANRGDIVSHYGGKLPTNPAFTFFGVNAGYATNRFLARCQSWLRYRDWMREVLPQARALAERQSFDVVHHLTFATVRVASPLWKLGIPLVFGPTGGGETIPAAALTSMSRGQRAFERLRSMSNGMLPFDGRVRATIRHASVLLASNRVTANLLRKLGAAPGSVFDLPVVFFTDEQVRELTSRPKLWSGPHEPLRLFASGMVEGRKGISIALHAIAKAKAKGVSVEFIMPSRGPEFVHLQALSARLGLEDVVRFPDSLPREEFWRTLMRSDVVMMPSLRDNCPATLLEAMLCRCVPFVVDCNGPGEMVPGSVGIKTDPATPETMASNFAAELVRLAEDRGRLRQMGEAAAAHVRRRFSEEAYLRSIGEAYNRAVRS